jgi:hypothetical protein
MIAAQYEEKNSQYAGQVFTNSVTIGQILSRSGYHPGPLANLGWRPDLTNMATNELYEIKPWTDMAGALAQRDKYIAVFQNAGVNMQPGTQIGMYGHVSAPDGMYRYWAEQPGAVLYNREPSKAVPESIVSLSLLAAGIYSLYRTMIQAPIQGSSAAAGMVIFPTSQFPTHKNQL